jgi:hypothetical protein
LDDPNYVLGNVEGVVEAISLLDLSRYTLGEVIDFQGEPDFALAVPNDEDSALFYAIYEEKALLVLGLIVTVEGLTEETAIVGAQYYAPSAMGELLSNAAAPAWTGYASLADYIRE